MKTYLLREGNLNQNLFVFRSVTRKRMREYAVELAIINGRSAQEVLKSDWEHSKHELTHKPDIVQEVVIEMESDCECWDEVHGLTHDMLQPRTQMQESAA